jgi:hypothetical protein
MQSNLQVRIKRLFLLTLVLKVACVTLGWVLNDPVWLGCVIPLALMGGYALIGRKSSDRSISDEKFADSCYYLGFLFTIVSIIVSLLDVPHIGTNMTSIAVRFGAAMMSTALGLGMRVYLVTFREEMTDALRSAEDGVIDATHRLRDQLVFVLEKLQDFENQVDDATSQSVVKVKVGVEQLTEFCSQKLADFFRQLAAENTKAFDSAIKDVRDATQRLSVSVNEYSAGMRQNIDGIQDKVVLFADAVTDRLEQTTFPDDYFATGLAAPVATLGRSVTAIADQVTLASLNMGQSLDSLQGALAAMRSRSGEVDAALQQVVELASIQDRLLAGSQAQLQTLGVLTATLEATQQGLGRISGDVAAQSELLATCGKLLNGQNGGMERIVLALEKLFGGLDTAVAAIRSQQEVLATMLSDTSAQRLTTEQVNQRLAGLGAALGELTASMTKNSHGLSELSQLVANEHEKALVMRTATLDATKRIDLTTKELPLVKDAVQAMSERIDALLPEMRHFGRNVTSLASRFAKHNGQLPRVTATGNLDNVHANGIAFARISDTAPSSSPPSDDISTA